MREIILQPGTAIEVDGVRIRAAEPGVSDGTSVGVYDPATGSFSLVREQTGPLENPPAVVSTTGAQQC